MTAAEIAELLGDTITPGRVAKARALAGRQRVAWSAVVTALTDEQRRALEALEHEGGGPIHPSNINSLGD